jgi:aarF domain-containing kinase
MLPWPRALPLSRRSSPFTPLKHPPIRHISYWARNPTYSRLSLRRPAFWLVPIAGGISLYFYPRPQPVLSEVFASPTLIPCPSNESSTTSAESLILSPSEHNLSISEYICSLFVDRIWEPILTARRFIHLFFLFLPVILSSPMLLVGPPEDSLQRDRWGAVWWYGYFVAQMDRAGPTFIKVRNAIYLFSI